MKLYIYDHCPFCVRARMIFGLRGIPFDTVVLSNDDEDTPIRMIGAKQVPILEKYDGSFMGESLDIVRHIDESAGKGRLKEDIRPEIQTWFDKVGDYSNKLSQPRYIRAGLPEFATPEAIAYFQTKKEKTIGSFAKNLDKTAQYLDTLHQDLSELSALTRSSDGLNGETGMEDILVFPVLRNLTIVRGIEWPSEILSYLDTMSAKTGVPLYFDRAM